MTSTTSIGTLLRGLRIDSDLTIEELALRSGISIRAIGDIERGVRAAPQRRTVSALARALQLQGERRDQFLDAARSARSTEPGPWTATAAARPHALWDFTGRSSELQRIDGLLRDVSDPPRPAPPLVLTGIPGVGKTTLALEAARRFLPGDDLRYVNLLGASKTPMTPLAVLQALLQQQDSGDGYPNTLVEAHDEWRRSTADGRAIVVLDDAATEAQVRPALDVGPEVRVIVTSRRRLAGLEGARHVAIDPLRRAESIDFLSTVIPAEQHRGDDLPELAQLCGDLPLALRIIAGRITSEPSTTASDLLDQFRSEGRRLSLLKAGDLEMERVFLASYSLLTSVQQQTLRDLALLPTRSFPCHAAAAIRPRPQDESWAALDDLVALGLVEPLGRGRYRLHDLIRIFAAARLEKEDGDRASLAEAVDRWYLAGAARAVRAFASAAGADAADSTDAAAWLRDEADGWFGAFARLAASGRHGEVVEHAGTLGEFMYSDVSWGRWHEFSEIALASAERLGDRSAQALNLARLGYAVRSELFDDGRAADISRAAAALADEIDDADVAGQALSTLAMTEHYRGDVDGAIATMTRAGERYAVAGSASNALEVRFWLADWTVESDPAHAERELLAVLQEIRELRRTSDQLGPHGDDLLQTVLVRVARLYLMTERPHLTIDLASEAIEVNPHDPGGVARARAERGVARAATGDFVRSLEDLHAALAIAGARRPQFWADRVQGAIEAAERSVVELHDESRAARAH